MSTPALVTAPTLTERDEIVLVLLPISKDGTRVCRALAAEGLQCVLCKDMAALCQGIAEGAGVALVTEEAVAADRAGHLNDALRRQPAWSDFPLVVLTGELPNGRQMTFRETMNVTLLERPVRIRSLLSLLRAALRSRRHQYAVRGHMAQHEQQAQSLRDNEARLQFALSAGKLGAWQLDLPEWELTCSDICKSHYGRLPADTFTYQDLEQSVHLDDRQRMRQAVIRSLTEHVDYDIEYRTIWPDGSVHWVLVRGRVAPSAAGMPLRMSGVSLDVTKQKQAELQLRDADRRKDEFLALLAHELRNPLAPLRNGLQVLRLSRVESETCVQARGMMERQLTHMVRLIDDLLDVSRISRNKMELRRSEVLLANVIEHALETARPLIEGAGHELTISVPPEPIPLDADLTRLSQVLSNLLGNAAKYTAAGGQIRLTAELVGEHVMVCVQDTGIGIPATSLPNIFDMFSQVDRSLERTKGGLGIGLALVKGLVEMHGGTVAADSAGPDAGSTFTVHLPVMKTPLVNSSVSGQQSLGVRPKRRVLVVDDNVDAAITLAMMLRCLGDEVAVAHDGLQAVEEAERFKPEIILMDIGMPRLNGYEATRRIRQQAWAQDVAVIALTGWGQEKDIRRSHEAGCNGHLVKPVNLPELHEVLAKSNHRTDG